MTAWGSLALAWALHVGAPAEGSALRWSGGEGCPSEGDVVASVERYLGGSIAASSDDGKRIAAAASKQRDGWVARVEVIDDGGARTRTLPAAPTCAEAADAAALVIAIAIDPAAVERTEAAREEGLVPEPEPLPEPEPVPEPQPEPEPRPEPAPKIAPAPPKVATEPVPPRAPSSLRGAIGIHGGVEFGALPRVTGIVGASASLLGRRFRVFVDVNVLPRDRFAVDGAQVDFRLWAVGVGACPVFAVATRWSLAPCLAIEGGQLIAAPGDGFVEATGPRPAAWAAARAIGRVQFKPHRLVGLHLGPELVVPFVRPNFLAGTPDPVHESRLAGVRGTLGVEVQFP